MVRVDNWWSKQAITKYTMKLKRKFSKPKNMTLLVEALRADRGLKSVFHSDRDREKGEALLEELRQTAPVDDARLGLHAILTSLEHYPEEIDRIRLVVARAPKDIQGHVLTHGVVEASARADEIGQSALVRQLF